MPGTHAGEACSTAGMQPLRLSLCARSKSHSRIVVRRNGTQFFLHGLAHLQLRDEIPDRCLRNGLVCTRQGFQGLVGMGIALAPQYGLDGFGHDAPAIVQVATDGTFVQQQLAQALQRALNGYQSMPQGHSHIAQYGRVRQIAL